MEWPYEHPRRGDMPPGHHALTLNEYTIRKPPYAAGLKQSKVYSYVQGWSGPDYSKNIVVNEKEHPYTGTNYAWVRARCLGGKTNIWGRLALRLSDFDFKAKSRDGYGEDWPISYQDIAPYYDRVDQYLGISGVKENLPHLPDSIFQRPTRLNAAEVTLRNTLKTMDRVLTPYRAGVTTEGLKHNKYRSRCYGRGACARRDGWMRHPRGVRLADRPDLPGDGYRQPDAPHERDRARDPRRHGHRQGPRRRVRRRRERTQLRGDRAASSSSPRRRSSRRGCSCSRSPRTHPNGIGNSSGHVGHNFCEHVMGPSVTGLVKDRIGAAAHQRRRPARRVLRAALPQPGREAPEFHPRLRVRGWFRHHDVSRQRARDARLRRRLQEARPRLRRRVHQHGRIRGGAAALREPRGARPRRSRIAGASPCSGSTTGSATTRRRCARTWSRPRRRCSSARDSRSSTSIGRS